MKPDTAMMSYQHPTIYKDDTAVPLGTTTQDEERVVPSGNRLSTKMIAIVAAGLLMLMVAGGAVWMQDIGSLYNHSSGSFKTVDGDLTSEYGAVGDSCYPKGKPCVIFIKNTCKNCCGKYDTHSGYPVGTCN